MHPNRPAAPTSGACCRDSVGSRHCSSRNLKGIDIQAERQPHYSPDITAFCFKPLATRRCRGLLSGGHLPLGGEGEMVPGLVGGSERERHVPCVHLAQVWYGHPRPLATTQRMEEIGGKGCNYLFEGRKRVAELYCPRSLCPSNTLQHPPTPSATLLTTSRCSPRHQCLLQKGIFLWVGGSPPLKPGVRSAHVWN
jgi:hypothetical protein